MGETGTDKQLLCAHCGEECAQDKIQWQGNSFCCSGCKLVYQLLDQSGLCDYYSLNDRPGINQRAAVRKDKFAFLEDPAIRQRLIRFSDDSQTHVTFYLPQMHCSSCLYLLENLPRLHPAVIRSTVHFPRKEAEIVFDHRSVSLRELAELLTSIGYEPYISLNDLGGRKPRTDKNMIYRLGVAGFCFANIMLLSFPAYLGIDATEKGLEHIFRLFNFALSLPVFLYSAMPFYESGWKGLRHKFLNIDAPIALAIIVTFIRSVYEIAAGTGPGYFDSMAGIVFFMLVGRVLQDKTYQHLSFERDYTSYFPVAVTVLREQREVATLLPGVQTGDTLLIHHEELIPADGILTKGKAFIDYSFVTGESAPVPREMGEIVYAGGKQTAGNIEILVIREVTQSYLTRLWSKDEFKKTEEPKSASFVHLLSRYFTYIVLTIAALAAAYWLWQDGHRVWNVVTAVLIVACPCALLLSNTFTNGNILRLLGKNHFYLRNAQTIENIAGIDHIVFDKTGTLTSTREQKISYEGKRLGKAQQQAIAALAAQSHHPLSRALARQFGKGNRPAIDDFHEYPGKGAEGWAAGVRIALGSPLFITGQPEKDPSGTTVHVAFDGRPAGRFIIRNHYREGIAGLIRQLSDTYPLSVISGDQPTEKENLRRLLGRHATILFDQKPEDKLAFIRQLQLQGKRVMMIGDGLNDAGALRQSDAGIAVAEDTNNFTPASDAILEASQLPRLPRFIRLCRANKQIVIAAFVLSIAYNVIGILFAVQGRLSPLTAAILMPASSVSIVLLTFGSSSLLARRLKI